MSHSSSESGTSHNGSLQEALSIAIATALAKKGGADTQINWKLEEVHGTQGGIAGVSKVTVKISYS